MEIADSIYNSYVFTNEDTIMKGGYQFQKSIKRASIKRSPTLIKGGSYDYIEENEFHRFENLVIPIGLVLNSYKNLSSDFKIKEFYQEDIDTETFDKLFESVLHKTPYQKIKDRKSKKNKSVFGNNITKRLLP
jgi:hypothetical protein